MGRKKRKEWMRKGRKKRGGNERDGKWNISHLWDKFKLHCSSFLLYYYFHIQMCSQTNDFCVFKPWVYLLYNLDGLKEKEREREGGEKETERERETQRERERGKGRDFRWKERKGWRIWTRPRFEDSTMFDPWSTKTKGIDDGFWVLKSVPFRLRSVQRRMKITMRNEMSFMMLCSRFWSKQEMNRERERERERESAQIFTPQTNVQFKSIPWLPVSLRVRRRRRRSICHEKYKVRNDLDQRKWEAEFEENSFQAWFARITRHGSGSFISIVAQSFNPHCEQRSREPLSLTPFHSLSLFSLSKLFSLSLFQE